MSTDGGLLSIACEKIADLDVPAYVKDSELRYVAVNAAYAAFFGRAIGEFPGATSVELMGRSEDAGREDKERRALVFGEEEAAQIFDPQGAGRLPLRLERFVCEDDRLFLFGFGDQPQLWVRPTNASAERSAAPQSDALSDVALFRMALEDLPVATFVRDEQHRLIFANDAYVALSGIDRDRLMYKTEVEGFSDRGAQFYRNNCETYASGGTHELEEEIPGPDGAMLRIISRSTRVETADGRRYLVGSMTDVSRLAVREEGLVEARTSAQDMYRHVDGVLRALPVGVLIIDGAYNIEYANDAFKATLCDSAHHDVVGMTLRDLIACNLAAGRYGATNQTADEVFSIRVAQLNAAERSYVQEMSGGDGRLLAVTSARIADGGYLVTYSDVTALHLQEQQSILYRSALEQLNAPFFLRDDEARLIFVNSAFEQLVGLSSEQLIGTTAQDVFPDTGDARHEDNLRVLAGGDATERSEMVEMSDGNMLPAITHVNRIVTPDHKRYLAGKITDVSLLKAREHELIEAQAKAEALYSDLDGVLRTMPVGIIILDAALNIEFANAKIHEIWGWPEKEEIAGRSFRDYSEFNHKRGITWALDKNFEENFDRRATELRALDDTIQSELNSSDGKLVVVTSKRLADGRILITYSDITEIRRHEQEISAARAQFEELGSIMQDATGVMSQGLLVVEDGIVKLCNAALSRILDIPPALLEPGRAALESFVFCAARGDHGADPESVLAGWAASVAAGQNFSTTYLVGGKTWVDVEASVSDGGPSIIVCTDVTETKSREEELTRLLALAETADRAKSEFLANMSHEIRTPMNGVLGMAELLARSALDTRQKTFVDIIVKSGNALLTIINDILDFSKIDAGQLRLRKAPFDPVEAIEDVATLLSMSAAHKDIELIVRGDATVRHLVLGDPGRFRQIVTNLVGNAIKFTEKGHVLIELSAEQMESGMLMLTFRVEDTGIGIPEAKRLSIFDKFSQVDASSTRRHEGTGLGLAITAGLVELFGGYIEVDSAVGRGSVFTTHMPFAIASARGRQQAVPITVQDARILVIDDNAINRAILSEQLAIWGFDGVAVDGGAAGIAILDEAARLGIVIDALVIDYQMPDMNGLDVARLIRDDRRFDDIGIIFLTSMDMVGDERIFEQLKVQAHLMKPARANLLRGAIVDVVRAGRLRHAGSTQAAPPLPATTARTTREPAMPAAAATSETPVVASKPYSSDTSEKMSGRAYDVLVAEDNEVNQIVFSQILQSAGLTYLMTGDGRQAVDAWQRHGPGLILMDVSMPVMNGLQAARTIREKEREAGDGRHVPIVGVTAHALESDRELCLAAGMDDYLSKPISPELLEQKINQWLDIRAKLTRDGRGSGG
ncbi:MAG: PAS-domain containing protein [Allorhizobium sp.]